MEIYAIFLIGTSLLLILFSLYDLFNNKKLTEKYKTNYYFIIFVLPVLGSIIYLYTKEKYSKK